MSSYFHKIFSSRAPGNANLYVGEIGRIFYDQATGILRLSDGKTPGGIIITSSGLLLETDGNINLNQKVLNLVGGNQISLTNYSNGAVVFDVSGNANSITLETNGNLNSSQTILNLSSNIGIGLTDYGAGNIFIETTTHSETLTDGNSNIIYANGDVVVVVGVPN